MQASEDSWEKYMLVYMEAIRDKFYPVPSRSNESEKSQASSKYC